MERSDPRNCAFCVVPAERIMLKNELAFAMRDKYPVSPGHTLVIPKRHVAEVFDLNHDEVTAIMLLVAKVKALCDREFDPQGYNLGVNVGCAAGQTIHHAHVHVIPRYDGDMVDATGGVRHVIPGKAKYPMRG